MKFIMSRDRTIATRTGHCIAFKKGEPVYVPPGAWAEVQAAGAVPEEDIPETPPSKNTPPASPEARAEQLALAIQQLLEGGRREDFTGGGLPHAKALAAILGWTPTNDERTAAWNAHRAPKD